MSPGTIHSEAMDFAEQAEIARFKGDKARMKQCLTQALQKERQAAALAVEQNAPEPTRSILLKSAAHLAIDCGELRVAEQLIGLALAGDPPDEIAEELRRLFEEVGFNRHLDVRGMKHQDNAPPIRMEGRILFYDARDEDSSPIIKLITPDKKEWRLKAEVKGFQKALRYAVAKKAVVVTGKQVGKATLEIEELKAVRHP